MRSDPPVDEQAVVIRRRLENLEKGSPRGNRDFHTWLSQDPDLVRQLDERAAALRQEHRRGQVRAFLISIVVGTVLGALVTLPAALSHTSLRSLVPLFIAIEVALVLLGVISSLGVLIRFVRRNDNIPGEYARSLKRLVGSSESMFAALLPAAVVAFLTVGALVLFGVPGLRQSGPTLGSTPGWNSLYHEEQPACDDSSSWQDVNHAATRECTLNGLVLSQYSNTQWAELDLDKLNGNAFYNQTTFRVSTHVGFLNSGDTSVSAGIIVQTPQAAGVCGGYILAVNSQGAWKLQQINSSCAIPTLASGQVNLDATTFTLQIAVQGGQLTAYVNGQQVVRVGDGLNPSPGAIGLLEESPRATSSAILYNQFELYIWS